MKQILRIPIKANKRRMFSSEAKPFDKAAFQKHFDSMRPPQNEYFD